MGTRIGTKIGPGAPGTAFIEYDLSANFNAAANQTFTNAQVLDASEEGVDYGSLTVVDAGAGTVKVASNLLEITGTGSWDETGVRSTSGVTKALGKAFIGTLTHNTNAASLFGLNTAAGIVRANGMAIEFSAADALTVTKDDKSATLVTVGAVVDATTYKLLVLQGGFDSSAIPFKTGDTVGNFTYGLHYFIKGGTFTNWTRIWLAPTDNTGTLYPYAQVLEAAAVNYDTLLDPTNVLNVDTMFQPNFLDTFAGTNDDQLVSAHTPEVVGGATGTGNPWESGSTTWTIQSNTANNNPGLDADIAPNNTCTTQASRTEADATTSWTNNGMNTFESVTEGTETDGSYSLHLVAGDNADGAYTSATTVVGLPYKVSILYKKNAATDSAALRIGTTADNNDVGNQVISGTTWTTYTRTIIAESTTTYFSVRENGVNNDTEIWVDVLKIEPITLNEVIASYDMSITQGLFDINFTGDHVGGFIIGLDDKDTPANFVWGFYNKSIAKVQVFKIVAGVGTKLIEETATYAAGATLRAIVDYVTATDDVKVKVYYNGALIGTEQTIEDNGIAGNTRFGILSVHSSNSLDNFVVYPRTNSNWDTEISNATGGVY